MTGCHEIWENAPAHERAGKIDAAHPNCACEHCSVSSGGLPPVDNDEYLVRILTTPTDYNSDNDEINRARMTALHSSGVSLMRQNAPSEEFELAIKQLTEECQEKSELYGAAIFKAASVRLSEGDQRKFCVYDTDADKKKYHADLVATTPRATGSSQRKKQMSDARKIICALLDQSKIEARTSKELIAKIKSYPTEAR